MLDAYRPQVQWTGWDVLWLLQRQMDQRKVSVMRRWPGSWPATTGSLGKAVFASNQKINLEIHSSGFNHFSHSFRNNLFHTSPFNNIRSSDSPSAQALLSAVDLLWLEPLFSCYTAEICLVRCAALLYLTWLAFLLTLPNVVNGATQTERVPESWETAITNWVKVTLRKRFMFTSCSQQVKTKLPQQVWEEMIWRHATVTIL